MFELVNRFDFSREWRVTHDQGVQIDIDGSSGCLELRPFTVSILLALGYPVSAVRPTIMFMRA